MKEGQSEQSVGGDRPSTKVERRTLLQLALAASAGAALPGTLSAQPPPTDGHPKALETLLDRATNYDSGSKNTDKRIWQPAGRVQRQKWFDELEAIGLAKADAIVLDKGTHKGVKWPTDAVERRRYENTIDAARVVSAQIPIARERIQRLLLDARLEAMWYAYQVGYRDGYCQAVKDETPKCDIWEDVVVKGLTPATICAVQDKSGDPDNKYKLQEPQPALFDPDLCSDGIVHGHESY